MSFIVLEGPEAVGKSTQIELLADRVHGETGRRVVKTFEPGRTNLGAELRRLVLDGIAGPITPRAEALLIAADRAEHVARVVRPALDDDAVVISDRYVPSSLAYQGHGRGLPIDEIERLSTWATEGLRPDLVVVLIAAPDVTRTRQPDGPGDLIESEDEAFHERVRTAYRTLAEQFGWTIVDGSGTVDDVAERIWAAVQPVVSR